MTLAVRFGLYIVDAISLRLAVRKAAGSDADVIIFDRYHYDELANLGLSNRITQAYARLLLWFVPQPDISFLLDADPIQARARKPEYPVDFLHISPASCSCLRQTGGNDDHRTAARSRTSPRECAQQALKHMSSKALRIAGRRKDSRLEHKLPHTIFRKN